MLLITGIADVKPGDRLKVADAAVLRVPLGDVQHTSFAAGPRLGQVSDRQVSTSTRSPHTWVAVPAFVAHDNTS